MSEDNVEIWRTALEGFRELAPEDTPEQVAQFWEPDGDYYPQRAFPSRGHVTAARRLRAI
jgi:hypothetical protein